MNEFLPEMKIPLKFVLKESKIYIFNFEISLAFLIAITVLKRNTTGHIGANSANGNHISCELILLTDIFFLNYQNFLSKFEMNLRRP